MTPTRKMLTATLENVLNRGLPRSPRARQLCAALAGKRVRVEVAGFGCFLLESNGTSLKVLRAPQPTPEAEPTSSAADTVADAAISGSPLSLLALAGPSPQTVLQRGDVQIRGDAEVADQFRELTLLLRPDLEEELSLLLGDVPAHQIGRLARATLGWGRKAAGTTARNIAEYLAHETRDVVSRREAEPFLADVDRLREDVDRLEARVAMLTQP